MRSNNPVIGLPFQTGSTIFLWFSVLSSFIFGSLHFVNNLLNHANFSSEDYNHSLLFCYFVVDLITGITGLYGIQESKPKALIPFLLYKVFDIIWMTALLLYDTSNMTFVPTAILQMGFRSKNAATFWLNEETDIFILFAIILILAFKVYCTLLLYKFYFILTEELSCKGKAYAILKPKAVCYIMFS